MSIREKKISSFINKQQIAHPDQQRDSEIVKKSIQNV